MSEKTVITNANLDQFEFDVTIELGNRKVHRGGRSGEPESELLFNNDVDVHVHGGATKLVYMLASGRMITFAGANRNPKKNGDSFEWPNGKLHLELDDSGREMTQTPEVKSAKKLLGMLREQLGRPVTTEDFAELLNKITSK